MYMLNANLKMEVCLLHCRKELILNLHESIKAISDSIAVYAICLHLNKQALNIKFEGFRIKLQFIEFYC